MGNHNSGFPFYFNMQKQKIIKLKNGLRILLLPKAGFNSTYFSLLIKAGSMVEAKGSYGLAHVAEHIVYRRILERLQGQSWVKNYLYYDFQATTDTDETQYRFFAAAKDSELVLDLLSQALSNHLVDDDYLSLEKQIIREEILEDRDGLNFKFNQYMRDHLYPKHPLQHLVLGTAKTVGSFSATQVSRFLRDFYRPNNAILVVSGKITVVTLIPKIKKYFGGLAKRAVKNQQPLPRLLQNQVYCFDRQSEQINFDYFKIILNSDPWENVRQEFVIGLAHQYLTKKIREQGYCYSLSVDSHSYNEFTEVWIDASFQAQKTVKFLQLLKASLLEFKDVVTMSDFNNYKQTYVKSVKVDMDYPRINADVAGAYMLTYGQAVTLPDKLEVVKAMTLDDVLDRFDQLFNLDSYVFFGGKLNAEQKQKLKKLWQ